MVKQEQKRNRTKWNQIKREKLYDDTTYGNTSRLADVLKWKADKCRHNFADYLC